MPIGVEIREVDAPSRDAWRRMRCELGPAWVADADAMVESYFASKTIDGLRHVVLIAHDLETDAPIGMAEVSLRDFAEGCSSNPVGYLEGWFVEKHARGQGVGRAILEAAENWARAQSCREFASDVELDNAGSLAAHEHLGFNPVCDIRCFRKSL